MPLAGSVTLVTGPAVTVFVTQVHLAALSSALLVISKPSNVGLGQLTVMVPPLSVALKATGPSMTIEPVLKAVAVPSLQVTVQL